MLAGIFPQTSAKLLDKDSRGIGRPEEQDHIDAGNIDALIQNINGEQDLEIRIIILQIIVRTDPFADIIFPCQVCSMIVDRHCF